MGINIIFDGRSISAEDMAKMPHLHCEICNTNLNQGDMYYIVPDTDGCKQVVCAACLQKEAVTNE